jgi:uncharacterized DUF497 family protein
VGIEEEPRQPAKAWNRLHRRQRDLQRPQRRGLERFGNGEPRIIAYGQLGSHVIAVVFCWREDRRRIISARKATRSETKMYWEIVYGDT